MMNGVVLLYRPTVDGLLIFVVLTEWHVSVIALLMFTLSFGLMAIILSLGGLCSSSLPKKIYYYHSAGEIYVICGEFVPRSFLKS